MTFPKQLTDAQASPEPVVNANFANLRPFAIGSERSDAHSGLVWGYWGGTYLGNTTADGTVTLTNSATNYLVILRSTGAVSVSTSTTNSLDDLYATLATIVVAGGLVTSYTDTRTGTNGLFAATQTDTSVGKHSLPISAVAMVPSATGGCAVLAQVATMANVPDLLTLDFDASTQEFAQFSVAMPPSWNGGQITFQALWSHAATSTNFGVAWSLQAVAVSNDDAIAAPYGTAVNVTDTGGTTQDLYITNESAGITVGGSPQTGDMVFFRISRDTSDGGDTMAIDARLHGIRLFITTDAATDA